ncbi:MAG: OsmC family protein [Actinomycetota bacterium]
MAGTLRVAHQGGDRFTIEIRGHTVTVDQPVDGGGEDTAPTPTELFVAGLASCVAFYARRYLARHQLPFEGLEVAAEFTMATGPARVGAVDVTIRMPEGVPAERLDALLAVASHCTVHNSLEQPPVVRFTLEEGR